MNKSIAYALALAAVSATALADSSVNFANGTSVGLPLVSDSTGTAIHSANYVAQLFESTDNGASFSAVGTTSPFFNVTSTSVRAGVWKTQAITLTGVNPGSAVSFKVAVWDSTVFSSWDAAAAEITALAPIAGKLNAGDSFQAGVTSAFTYNAPVAGDLNPADFNLTNFKGLQLTSYTVPAAPEPSVIALGALGLGALLWRRRN